ncbi:MAG: TonB-dependent receptor [Prevotella sp.]|jgi:TonB-linked SusC/RagA family outer membrane protein|nr:TonB-dependent receptor [Prevotella sp.]
MRNNKTTKNYWCIRQVLIGLLMLCLSGTAYTQDNASLALEGTVYDEFGETLVGLAIYLKDRPGTGWMTDDNGKFSVKADRGDMLVFTYIGYEPIEYLVTKSEKDMKVQMKPTSHQLDEMVIVGMGQQRKVSVVGAITSVDVSQLQVPATSINNMLGGRVAGVISMQSSGEPGKNISEFWVRGIGTFGANSSALVLIDGLEGSLSQVDPADIESFSILKDASATAVYGVRGANGVVLITTKRGVEDKLSITVRSNLKLSVLQRMPDFLDAYDYAKLANEASIVSGNQARYSDVQLEMIKYGLDPDLFPNVNWRDEILNKTSWQNTQYISARGGGSVAKYFLSLGMSQESAAYKQDKSSKYRKNVGYNTYNYRTNLDINLTKTTQLYLGLDGYISINNLPGAMDTDQLWSSQAKLTPLTVPTQYSNGLLPAYGVGDLVSPYILLNHTGMSTKETYKNMATLAVSQDLNFITKGLKARVQGAFDNQSYFDERRHKMPDLYNSTRRTPDGDLVMIKRVTAYDAQYTSSESQWRKYFFEGTVNYDKVVDEKHRFGGLLYYYMSSEKWTTYKTSMSAIPKKYQGISARLTYGFQDTYMLDVNFGYTGSENFKKGEQFGFFPSVALGWIPTQYEWTKDNLPFLSFLKIRGSYGTVGNDRIADDRFPYLTIINSNAAGGWGGSGLIETVVGADNLKWEVSKKADVGIEGKLFNDKLEFVVDAFHDKRDGIFQKRTQLPTWVGSMSMPYGNVGSMVSYGADGNLSYRQDFSKDLSFTVRGNFTYSTNKIKSWEQPYQKYDYLSYIDKPYNVLRGYKAIGLFKDDQDVLSSPTQFGNVRPGDIKYKDINGDGKIDTDDMVPLSYSPFPRLMYGFGLEGRYKAFTFGVLFKGTGNTDFFKHSKGDGYLPFYGSNTGNVLAIANEQQNRWTPAWYSGDPSTEREDVLFPRLTYGPNENNDKYSSFWLGNSRYLRLEEVTLNYNLRLAALKRILSLNSIDVQFVGRNLYVWDTVKIWDPEQAKDNGYKYPIPMTFTLQLYLNF